MYAWIWARLPGPTAAKVLISLALVFPWAVTWLPGQDVSVDPG